jgi:hypothetical protein
MDSRSFDSGLLDDSSGTISRTGDEMIFIPCRGAPHSRHLSLFDVIAAPQHVQNAAMTSTSACWLLLPSMSEGRQRFRKRQMRGETQNNPPPAKRFADQCHY